MSMHELEYLVEMSIKELDACITDDAVDLRTIFHQLYRWQGEWDTGFTHFRVIDILVKHRFAYQMDMSEHPKYQEHQSTLDQFVESAKQKKNPKHYPIHFLHFVDPTRDPKEETKDMDYKERAKWYADHPTAGYYRYPYLYADAGSPLWEALVESGKLTDADAEAPNPRLSIIDIALMVVRCAEKQEHYDLILNWHLFLGYYLINEDESTHLDNPALAEIIDIVNRSDAVNKSDGYASFVKRFPVVETVQEYLHNLFNMED